jgi:Flp pilus assembly protein TadD
MAEVERALESRPGEADFVALAGDILRRQGNMREAAARHERVAELAPRDPNAHGAVCETLSLLRDFGQAAAACERALEVRPDYFLAHHQLAQIRLLASGDTAGARRWLLAARNEGDHRSTVESLEIYDLEMVERNSAAAIVEARAAADGAFNNQFRYFPSSLAEAFARRLGGDEAGARAGFEAARVELRALVDGSPTESRYRSSLGLALAGLGRDREAIREGEEGLRLMPPEKEAWRGTWRLTDLARIEAMTGREDAAIDRLERLLSIPSDLSVWSLRLDPAWDPLRANPRFEALVGEE